MANAGVGILAGCDMMIAGFCVHDELEAMVRGGMTPWRRCRPRRSIRRDISVSNRQPEASRPAHAADLVLLDANPLTDIANIGRIRAVLVAGRLMDRKELDKLLAQVRNAARQ